MRDTVALPMASGVQPWWQRAVLYQVYIRSFADSDGDGVGDLKGITGRLDYLEWLGVDALWLSPVTPSPDKDWGYDVADYIDVQPVFGGMPALDDLVAKAAERDIQVIIDLVPNHTSDRHPWFEEARAARDSPRRDWYVWADPKPDGSAPNNWRSAFGGVPAWTLDERTGQYYLHNFLPDQPDLNWWSEDVRSAFDDILRFWLDRGIAGFRIDVAHGIVKDRELRDNPPATEDDTEHHRWLGQQLEYSMNREEVHDVFRRWRSVTDPYDGVLLGETWVLDLERLMRFYGDDLDELHLAFNFVFLLADFGAEQLAPIVAETERLLPEHAWPTWTLGNHDMERFPTRWTRGDPGLSRCALMLLLTLRGTPVLYYGDELAMPDTEIPRDRVVDPVGLLDDPRRPGRDGARTPMPWRDTPGLGFTVPGVEPWLPFGEAAGVDVESQRADRASALWLCRDLIALRREAADLRTGAYAEVRASDDVWVYRRGDEYLVALNLGDAGASVPARGAVAIGTDRSRDGEPVDGTLALGPREGAVVRLG